MALADQRFDRTDTAVREKGIIALIRSLGYTDALRFVVQMSPGQGDYLKWQEQAFGDGDVDDLYEQARRHWERRQDELDRSE